MASRLEDGKWKDQSPGYTFYTSSHFEDLSKAIAVLCSLQTISSAKTPGIVTPTVEGRDNIMGCFANIRHSPWRRSKKSAPKHLPRTAFLSGIKPVCDPVDDAIQPIMSYLCLEGTCNYPPLALNSFTALERIVKQRGLLKVPLSLGLRPSSLPGFRQPASLHLDTIRMFPKVKVSCWRTLSPNMHVICWNLFHCLSKKEDGTVGRIIHLCYIVLTCIECTTDPICVS